MRYKYLQNLKLGKEERYPLYYFYGQELERDNELLDKVRITDYLTKNELILVMKETENNEGIHTGFKNNETAIFINEKNYKEKFLEYLNDNENKKWKEIADAGNEFALKNFNNDIGVNSLADLMEELI